MGALLVVPSEEWMHGAPQALEQLHILVSEDTEDICAQIADLVPDVLLLSPRQRDAENIFTRFHEIIPWGYTVLLTVNCEDMALAALAAFVDEVWPFATVSSAQIRLLLRLSRLNRRLLRVSIVDDKEDPETEEIRDVLGANPLFMDMNRFICPRCWWQMFWIERSSLLADLVRPLLGQIPQGSALPVVNLWPETATEMWPTGDLGSPQKLAPKCLLVTESIRIEAICESRVLLISLALDDAFFPVASVSCRQRGSRGAKIRETLTDYVTRPGFWDLLRQSVTTDSQKTLLQETLEQASALYTRTLRSFHALALDRDAYVEKAFLETAVSSLGSALLLLDPEFRISFASEGAVSRLLMPDGEIERGADGHPSLIDTINVLRSSMNEVPQEIVLATAAGEMQLATTVPVYANKTRLLGYAVLLQSREAEVQDELRLQEGLAAVSQLAAGMAHEIRNPLMSIRGFTQLLKERLEAARMAMESLYAGYALEEIDRANQVITDFLNLSQPKERARYLVDMNQLCLKMLQLVESQAVLQGVYLTWQFSSHLPTVEGDGEALVQVLLNLVNNALQATPRGGTVHLSTYYANGYVKVAVEDTGVGISAEEQKMIFEPYFTTKEGGTGLGLALCRQIILEHQGVIRVASLPKQGTRFSIALPAFSESSRREN